MGVKLLEPFTREIIGGKEPDEHQAKFLYLPLSTLRNCTNIESIVTDDYIMLHAKQPIRREIDKAIEKCHQQMGQLNKWKHWKLSKLKFRLPQSDTDGAEMWSELDEMEMDEDREFSAHEKQFVYLPLAILNSATNIRQLFNHIKDEKKLDALIRKVHSQMSSKVWPPELLNLRFIDKSTESNVQNANETTTAKPKSRTTRLANMKATTVENSSNVEPSKRILRKRKNPIQDVHDLKKRKNLVAGNTRSKTKKVEIKQSKIILENISMKSQPPKVIVDGHAHSKATAIDQEPKNPTGSSEMLEQSADNELAQLAETKQYDANNQRDLYSPSEFQCEIEHLNFDDFVNKTNIKEIVQREIQKQNNDVDVCISDDDMDSRLKFFYEFRNRTTEWHINGIKNLKFTDCEGEGEQDSLVPKLDFNNVNHNEIDGLTLRKKNMPNVRDVCVQCDSIDTNDKSTSTSDLFIQFDATENQETNGQSADVVADKDGKKISASPDGTEMPLQGNENEPCLRCCSSEIFTNVRIDANVVPATKQPSNATLSQEHIIESLQTLTSADASQENGIQNESASVEMPCDITEKITSRNGSLPTIQINAAENQETNGPRAGGAVDKEPSLLLKEMAFPPNGTEMPLQGNENESSLIGTGIFANVCIEANAVPAIKQEPDAEVFPENITRFSRTSTSADVSCEKVVQNVSANVQTPCDIKVEEEEDLSEKSFETIDASSDFPSAKELDEFFLGNVQDTEELQMVPTISTHDELIGILSD